MLPRYIGKAHVSYLLHIHEPPNSAELAVAGRLNLWRVLAENLGAAEGHGFCCRASLTLRLYDSAWKRGFLTVFETFCRRI